MFIESQLQVLYMKQPGNSRIVKGPENVCRSPDPENTTRLDARNSQVYVWDVATQRGDEQET